MEEVSTSEGCLLSNEITSIKEIEGELQKSNK
jgi:hypothetical protein